MTGSDNEPLEPTDAAAQMRDATGRLRNQAWMVAPMTSSVPAPVAQDEREIDA